MHEKERIERNLVINSNELTNEDMSLFDGTNLTEKSAVMKRVVPHFYDDVNYPFQ